MILAKLLTRFGIVTYIGNIDHTESRDNNIIRHILDSGTGNIGWMSKGFSHLSLVNSGALQGSALGAL